LKKIAIAAVAALSVVGLAACGVNDADVVNENISKAGDNFEVNRRITFINNLDGSKPIQIVEGWCNVELSPDHITATCKSQGKYYRHYQGLNATSTYSIEQLDGSDVSKDHYRVSYKPSAVIPDINIR